MSLSDKISWVGGMMGLFTGFSVISGIEILYWLWFKVISWLFSAKKDLDSEFRVTISNQPNAT